MPTTFPLPMDADLRHQLELIVATAARVLDPGRRPELLEGSGSLHGGAALAVWWAMARSAGIDGPGPDTIMDQAVVEACNHPISGALATGFPGVILAMDLLRRQGHLPSDWVSEEQDAEIDELFALRAQHNSKAHREHELLYGLGGEMTILAQRPTPRSRELVGLALDAMERVVFETEHGEIAALKIKFKPDEEDTVDFGVAHGLPGAIGGLARAHTLTGDPRCLAMADGMMRLLARTMKAQGSAGLPGIIPTALLGQIKPSPGSRLAWCYGNLGAAVVLLDAARRFNHSNMEAMAHQLGAMACTVSLEDARVIDPWLCHGALGNAICFHGLACMTNETTYAEKARFWVSHGANQLQEPLDAAQGKEVFDIKTPLNDSVWLEGILGAGLAALTLLGRIDFAWATPLLLDGPSRT